MSWVWVLAAGLLGLALGAAAHLGLWRLRERRYPLTVYLGLAVAVALTWFGVGAALSPYLGELRQPLLAGIAGLWVAAFLIGLAQSRALPFPWWGLGFGVFIDAGAALLLAVAGAQARDALIRAGSDWRLQHLLWNTYAWVVIIALAGLALAHPFWPTSGRAR